jgi:aryl-alcohol dehydrogenase-like predicted oxidoreductase
LSLQVLDRALELGCTHLDTAALYKDREELIGQWCTIFYCFAVSYAHSTHDTYRLKKSGNRDKVTIATKFAIDQETGQIRGDPEFVREQWERSLKRLGVDCIDLFYQHRSVDFVRNCISAGAFL